MNLDIKRALQISFKGEHWFQNVLIGVVLVVLGMAVSQVPHVGAFLNLLVMSVGLGYTVKVMRQEATAAPAALPAALPEWSDWTGLVKDGILLTLANFIYTLGIGTLFFLATAMLGATATVSHAMAGEAVQISGGLLVLLLFFGFAALVLFALFMPLMAVHYAHENRFGACFEVGKIFSRLFNNFGQVILAVVCLIGLTFLTVLLSMTVILQPVAIFLAQVISANIWAQVYRNAGGSGK